jgi:hypothetical protein
LIVAALVSRNDAVAVIKPVAESTQHGESGDR